MGKKIYQRLTWKKLKENVKLHGNHLFKLAKINAEF